MKSAEGTQKGVFARFAAVGVVGFIVDAGLLFLALQIIDAPFGMRVLSFTCACLVTWRLNSLWTFRRPGNLSRYIAVQGIGMALNYAVYAATLLLAGQTAVMIALALVLGSASGLIWNFGAARRLVFRP